MPSLRVHRRLVLREHDERRARRVEARVHARGDLHAARQRETDVDAVEHRVRLERPADLADDLGARRDGRRTPAPWPTPPAGRDAARAGRCGPSTGAAPPTRHRRPAPTESNGLTPASSRCTSRPATLTIRLRLRSSKRCCTRRSSGCQSMAPELVIQRPALRLDRAQAPPGSGAGGRAGGVSNPVDSSTRAYHHGAQIPSVSRRPGGQASIRSLNGTPSASQSRRSMASGAASRSAESTTGRHAPGRRQHVIEDLDLLRQPRVGEREFLELLGERRQHRARVADQERMGHLREPVAPDIRQQVMRHLLLVEDARCRRAAARAASRRRAASRSRDARSPARVPGCGAPGHREVVRIERLVDDDRVVAVAPGPHQRGRDVAWSRPHRESQHAVAVSGQPCGTGR